MVVLLTEYLEEHGSGKKNSARKFEIYRVLPETENTDFLLIILLKLGF